MVVALRLQPIRGGEGVFSTFSEVGGWKDCQAMAPKKFRGLKPSEIGKWGKYQGTVIEYVFVVPFRHCPGRSMQAVFGCVGKVRASLLFRSFVLSL